MNSKGAMSAQRKRIASTFSCPLKHRWNRNVNRRNRTRFLYSPNRPRMKEGLRGHADNFGQLLVKPRSTLQPRGLPSRSPPYRPGI